MNEENWDECICNDCGFTWNASDTEHFDFTCCAICGSENIGGEYNEK